MPMAVHPTNASAHRAGRRLSMTTIIRRIGQQCEATGNKILAGRNIPRPGRNKAGAQLRPPMLASVHACHCGAKARPRQPISEFPHASHGSSRNTRRDDLQAFLHLEQTMKVALTFTAPLLVSVGMA